MCYIFGAATWEQTQNPNKSCSIFFFAVNDEVETENRGKSQKGLGAAEMIPTQIPLVSRPSSVAAHQGNVISHATVS